LEKQREEEQAGEIRELARDDARKRGFQKVVVGDEHGDCQQRDRVKQAIGRYGSIRSGCRHHRHGSRISRRARQRNGYCRFLL
jgi:hypothetical protein